MSVWNEFYLETKDSKGNWKCIDPGYVSEGVFKPQPIFFGNSETSFIVNDYFDESIEFSELSDELKTIKRTPEKSVLFKDYFLPKVIHVSLGLLIKNSKQKYDSSGIVRKLDYDNFMHGYSEYLCNIESEDLKEISDLEKKEYIYAEWLDHDGDLYTLKELVKSIYSTKSVYCQYANTDVPLENCRIVCFIY